MTADPNASAPPAVVATRERLTAVVEGTTDFVGMADANMKAFYVNRAGRRMLGLSESDELADMSIADFTHAPSSAVPEWREAVLRDGVWRGETVFRARDGREIFVSQVVIAHRTPAGDVEFYSTVARDVTEQRQTEADIRRAYRTLATLVAGAPLAIIALDVEQLVRTWNPAAEHLFGFTAAEAIGHPLPIVPPESRAQFERGFAAVGEDGSLIGRERRCLCKDGTLVDVSLSASPLRDAEGALVGSVAFMADITERKAGSVAAERARRSVELLLTCAGEGIVGVDVDGYTTFVNPVAATLLRTTRDRLVGRHCHNLVHHSRADGTPYPEADCPIHETIAVGTVRRVVDEVFWREDGSSFPVEYTSTAVREDGHIVGAVVTFQDITARRNLETQLRQVQKMEAVGRLAGGVAHDFNNVLTVITSYTSTLLSDLPAGDVAREDLAQIQAAADRAAALTHQLLAFSRHQVLQPRVVDLVAVVSNMEKMLRRLIGADVELVVVRPTGAMWVKADPGQLEQVLMNLAVNARDAMPTGGRLQIAIATVTFAADDRARLPYLKPGAYVQVEVRDTGSGMDEETRAKAFEPFFTTKESGKGTGLGLSTVYGIVKQSGGYIWVDSVTGEGSTFRFVLPMVAAAKPAPEVAGGATAEAPPSAQEAARTVATVLVVEDDAQLRTIIQRVLTARGYTVLAAASGIEALAISDTHPGSIDLLVSDVVMPQMSGQELAERLSLRRGEVPTLFMSGYSIEGVTQHGILRPGAHFVSKPFGPEQLALAASETLRDARAARE